VKLVFLNQTFSKLAKTGLQVVCNKKMSHRSVKGQELIFE